MALSDAEKFEWLNNDNHRIVLMDLEYYDDTHTLQTARFASYPYVQPIGDVWNTYSNLIYDDIISNVPNIITRVDTDSTIGAIDLLNTDGEFDSFLNAYTIVGHSIQLSIGGEGWIRDNFIVILDGIVSSIASNAPENIQLLLRDRKETLNVPLQNQLYIDTDTYDNTAWAVLTPAEKAATDEYWHKLMDSIETAAIGGRIPGRTPAESGDYSRALAVLPDATANTHVPICLGYCFNIEPVLIDSWNHIYHIHDSTNGINTVSEVRSNGVILTPITQYIVDIGLGVIRLLDHDQGTQITCDVVGQNGPSTLRESGAQALTAYSATDLIEWLLLEKANVTATDICYHTFPPIAPATKPFINDNSMGVFYKSEETVLNVVTKIINSVGGFLRFKSTDCKMQVILLDEPFGQSIDLNLQTDDIVENGISVITIEEPKKSITLGYKKNWKTQDEGSLAGALTDASSTSYDLSLLNSYKNEYSTLYKEIGLDINEYPLAEDVELVETSIWNIIDAQNELDRRVLLRGQRRRVIKINSLATSFTYDIGDIVFITHPRFDLELGKNAIIIGIEESPTNKRVNLDVWL